MYALKTERNLIWLLLLNVTMFALHMFVNYSGMLYFCQLTNISSVYVILNFSLSVILHERKSSHKTRRFLSNLHLMTLSLEAIVFLGFWGLRIFFSKGIIHPTIERTFMVELMSTWVHGGSLLTMFYFIKTDQIVLVSNKNEKYCFHLFWGIPYFILQFVHWFCTGEHVYGFLKYFTWVQLFVFQATMFFIAVSIDYYLNLRHGLQLTLNQLGQNEIEKLELEKEKQEKIEYLKEQKQAKKDLQRVMKHLKKENPEKAKDKKN